MIAYLKPILQKRAADIVVIFWGLALGFYFFASLFVANAFEERFFITVWICNFTTLYFWGAIGALDYHINKKKRLLIFRYPSTVLLLIFIFFTFIAAVYFGKTDIIDDAMNSSHSFYELATYTLFIAVIPAVILIGPFLFGYIVGATIRIMKKCFSNSILKQ
jgi:hypothetical protein